MAPDPGGGDIEVYLDGLEERPVRVGSLRPSFMGGRVLAGTSFQYDSEYLARRDGYAISPELDLHAGRTYTGDDQILFGAFADAAPDEWGQKIIEANHALRLKRDAELPRRLGSFDYLLGVSDHTRMGALRLRRGGADSPWLSDDAGVANMHELDHVVAAATRYEKNEASDDDLAYLADVATSPGGARPKANVVTDAGRLAIAKLPHSKDGDNDVESWEALAMTLAQRAGLRVPVFRRHVVGPATAVLVSERFDRDDRGRRIGYLSAHSAIGSGRTIATATYEDFAETVAEFSAAPAEDLRELFGRVALTVLINNVDDHWRNHGFVRGRNGWRLAPAFDLNPSRMRGVITSRAISAEDDPRERDLRNLAATAGAYGLRSSEAQQILRGVGEQVATWRRVAEELRIPVDQRESMLAAFDEDQLAFALNP